MLCNSKIVAFVATANSDKSLIFYNEVLGLTVLDDSPFAIEFDANGTSLRVQKVESLIPAPHTVLGWQVSDISSAVKELIKKGVSFEQFDNLPQDELGTWTTPDGAKVAWFKDPDGNTLSITQKP